MSFAQYPSYKDSGVAWLGEVPSHWEVAPAKHALLSRSGGVSIKGECVDEPTEGYYQGFSASGADVWLPSFDYDGPGLVLSAVGARCGKVFEANGKWGTVANTHCLIPKNKNHIRYLWYLTNDESWWEKGGTAQPFIKVSDTLARKISLPSPREQREIADFLDWETAKIDVLVEAQRRLIALLKEKRQAVISLAVTKGLDPSAPMKPSGIDWLGDVPAHWQLLLMTRVVSQFVDYRGATPNKVDEGVPLITAGQIKNGQIDHSLDPAFISEEEYQLRMTRGFPTRGDLLLTTEAPLGEAALVENESIAPGQRIILMKIDKLRMIGGYLLAHFQSSFGQAELWTRASGSTASGIRADRLRASQVLVPPLVEQRSIRAHIDDVTEHFNAAERESSAAIALLTERRAALISAAVTGKIDVRGLSTEVQKERAA